MKFDPQKHQRQSLRLKGYDYTQAGAYFITLVTYQRYGIFGEVVHGVVELSALGRIVQQEWLRSIEVRKEIRLSVDEFVIMPNHLHGIVWIVPSVGADGVRPSIRPENPNPNEKPGVCHASLPRRMPKSLGAFIAGFKSSVISRALRELGITGIWQRNYYDHIIRDEKDIQAIRDYMAANPQRWVQDRLHPTAPPNRFNQGK